VASKLVDQHLSPKNCCSINSGIYDGALKDRHSKYSIYESQGISYYLIISPDTEEVEVYKLDNGVYSLEQRGKNLSYHFSLGID
jgi:hypothetical protein